jgi:hypothetical protein
MDIYMKHLNDYDNERPERRCRICGCTDDDPCPEGCYWVEDDLCSACAMAEELARSAR